MGLVWLGRGDAEGGPAQCPGRGGGAGRVEVCGGETSRLGAER